MATEDTIQALFDQGLYDRAEGLARGEFERLLGLHGRDSRQVLTWSDMLVRALLLNGNGALPTTRALAERVVEGKGALTPSERCCLARSQVNLADALVATAEFTRASEILTETVAELSGRPTANQDELAEALEHLGTALILSDRNDEAIQVLHRSLEVKRNAGRPRQIAVAKTLLALGWALQRKGEYQQAATPIREAVAIAAAFNPDHPANADALSLLGLQLWFEGRPEEARDTSTRALAVAERTLRPDHPTTALALKRLAANVGSLGDLAQSRALKQRALAMAERTFGARHYETWAYLNDLAESNRVLGDYVSARQLFERGHEIAETRFGPWHDSVATAVHNLALVDASLGDYAKARIEQGRATAIWERVLGPDHTFVAVALTELASAYRAQGAYTEAVPVLQRALAIRQRRLGPRHSDVARTLTDLAATYLGMRELRRAQESAGRALAIWEEGGAADRDFAATLVVLGELQMVRGDSRAARMSLERALAIRAKVFGTAHPLYADTDASLAAALAMLGDRSSAIHHAKAAEETGREHLRLMVRSLPERESLNYAVTRPKALDLLLSLAGNEPGLAAAAVDAVIRSRALVLDEMISRVHSTSATSPDLADLRAKFVAAQQRLATLAVRGPDDRMSDRYSSLLAEARHAKESAERLLAERSATFRAELSYERAGLDDIRRAMPAGSVLLSFVRYARMDFTAAATAESATPAPRSIPSYLAFLLRSTGEPVVVPLGAADSIDKAVARWRSDIWPDSAKNATANAPAPGALRRSGARLRRAIWDSVSGHVSGATTVFVVPDDTLSLVPLAALPGKKAEYLIEEAPVIHYLSAERDLVREVERAGESARGLLAVGGPAFDDGPNLPANDTRANADQGALRSTPRSIASTRSNCGDFHTMTFGPLANAAREVQDVAQLWRNSGRTESALVLVAKDATERVFKREAAKYGFIHLATHGFFLGASCPSATDGLRVVGGLVPIGGSQSQDVLLPLADNPLLLSGVALAGANRRASTGPDDEDGILTAEEVSALDLAGVHWAVLSACDTGVGEVRAGEGVFGLRRAFQIAGARTVIMSLWSVEDDSTRLWMQALYEGRLQRKLTTAVAVREASLSVLRARRAARKSTYPFYWAAFVAAGDWR